jgi:hypothetical protein
MIWEPAHFAAPLDLLEMEEREERKRDAEFSVEIASRKKSTMESAHGSGYEEAVGCVCNMRILIVRDIDDLRLDDPALDGESTHA